MHSDKAIPHALLYSVESKMQRAVERAVDKMRDTHTLSGEITINPEDGHQKVDTSKMSITLRDDIKLNQFQVPRVKQSIYHCALSGHATAEHQALADSIIAELAEQFDLSVEKFNFLRFKTLPAFTFFVLSDSVQVVFRDRPSPMLPTQGHPTLDSKEIFTRKDPGLFSHMSFEPKPVDLFIFDKEELGKEIFPNPLRKIKKPREFKLLASSQKEVFTDPERGRFQKPYIGEFTESGAKRTFPDLSLTADPSTGEALDASIFGITFEQNVETIRRSFLKLAETYPLKSISFSIEINKGDVVSVKPQFIGDAQATYTPSTESAEKLEDVLGKFANDLRLSLKLSSLIGKMTNARLSLEFAPSAIDHVVNYTLKSEAVTPKK
ncbi:MAG: hypothetical protein KDD56_00780 [Bdellovibrionales bacterium]|nr:hypothetical protein [Bdellovibrionales bacterium]